MSSDGFDADVQGGGDLFEALAFEDHLHHLPLPGRETLVASIAAAVGVKRRQFLDQREKPLFLGFEGVYFERFDGLSKLGQDRIHGSNSSTCQLKDVRLRLDYCRKGSQRWCFAQ